MIGPAFVDTKQKEVGQMIPEFAIEYHVYDIRTRKGLSLRDLEDLSQISKSTINNIENGKYDPSVRTLCRLSLALDVSPHELFSLKM